MVMAPVDGSPHAAVILRVWMSAALEGLLN